ncbi:MAG TPA: FecR domain-containing protein [Verrucomicrobiae bacterium]
MKNIQTTFLAAACGLALAFTVSAQDKQGVATVVRVKGGASYSLQSGANAKWIPLVPGKVLVAGATIRTEPNGMVDVVLGKTIQMPQAVSTPDRISLAPDSRVRGMVDYRPSVEQNVIRLSGGTTLKIDTLTVSDTGVDTVSDTELDLQKGRIFASVKKLSAQSKYLVKIPNGIAGVRGTLFGLGADGWCGVILNSVWLSTVGPNGQVTTVQVNAGHEFNFNNGITLLPPQLALLLSQISSSLDTLYLQIVHYAYDRDTHTYISPTSGRFLGGNNNNDNNAD